MNLVVLSGRLIKDPEVRYNTEQKAFGNFILAVDRSVKKNEDKQADFPRIAVFGKTAEIAEQYLHKGDKITVTGRLQTGRYEKDGVTHYTTDVIGDKIEFLTLKQQTEEQLNGFEVTDDEIPF